MSKEIVLFDFDEVYRVALNVVICQDRKMWDKWLDDIGFTADRIDHERVNGCYYRILPDNNSAGANSNVIFLRTKNLSDLLHECTHLVFNQFAEKGVPIRVENDEAFAYYLEYWFNKVRKEWKG